MMGLIGESAVDVSQFGECCSGREIEGKGHRGWMSEEGAQTAHAKK
jgi:hypothetical protein